MKINKEIIIIALIIIIVIIVYITWKNKEGFDNDKKADIMLFYADWCPHCTKAKPEWNKVKDKFNGKTVNGYTLMFSEYNDKDKDKMSKYSISSFPTIKLSKNGNIYNFDAKPSESTINQFISTVLA